jgi:hypothetical protein
MFSIPQLRWVVHRERQVTIKLRNLKRNARLIRAMMPCKQQPIVVPLSNYPPELIEKIADLLPLEDFRNVRLINKTVNDGTVHLFARKYFRLLTIDITFDGLQMLVDISRHRDVSGDVRFGNSVRWIKFMQAVWSAREAEAWIDTL